MRCRNATASATPLTTAWAGLRRPAAAARRRCRTLSRKMAPASAPAPGSPSREASSAAAAVAYSIPGRTTRAEFSPGSADSNAGIAPGRWYSQSTTRAIAGYPATSVGTSRLAAMSGSSTTTVLCGGRTSASGSSSVRLKPTSTTWLKPGSNGMLGPPPFFAEATGTAHPAIADPDSLYGSLPAQ